MKQLRDILALCVSVVVMLAMTSCSGHSDRPGLVALDSLILQDPDSACELLAAYPAESLPTADDRAYHALLTTIADYKAYRPSTTDSVINIAVNHYDHSGANQDHRMRSLLYKGCVMEELGNPKQAMRYYKEAQYACSDNDNFHKGYIQYKIAALYRDCAEYQQAINHYMLALVAFQSAKAKVYERESVKFIGGIYRMIDSDSAYHYIKSYIKIARESKDSTSFYDGLTLLAGLEFSKSDYINTIKIANQILQNGKEFISDNTIYYLCCASYIKLNKIDSAKKILENYPLVVTLEDSVGYYQCKSDISKLLNDDKTAYNSAKIANEITSAVHVESENNGLLMIETDFDKAELDKKYFNIAIISITFIVLLLLVISYFVYRNKLLKKRANNSLSEISRLHQQIGESLLEISALKQQQEAARPDEQLSTLMGSIDNSLECYSSVLANLLKQMKASGSEKNSKLAAIMNDEFFAQLYRFVNLRHDNLVDRLRAPEFNLTNEEINIICLDLCKFPNVIQWTYSNCDRYHSLHNKKKKIANKVHNSETIADIPQNI